MVSKSLFSAASLWIAVSVAAYAQAPVPKPTPDPNKVTLFGVTLGEHLTLPECRTDAYHVETVRPDDQPCLHKSAAYNGVFLPARQRKDFPWMVDIGITNTSTMAAFLVTQGGGFGDMNLGFGSDSVGRIIVSCIQIATNGLPVHEAVMESLVQKFGKPASVENKTYTNENGASTKWPVVTWKSRGATVTLEYVGQLKAPAGLITVLDDRQAQKAKDSQRSKAAL